MSDYLKISSKHIPHNPIKAQIAKNIFFPPIFNTEYKYTNFLDNTKIYLIFLD